MPKIYPTAATDERAVNSFFFFDHLEVDLQGIPCNIWNYDETNIVANLGLKQVITRRDEVTRTGTVKLLERATFVTRPLQ